jgi:DNA-binding transcriptional LysR family regulator
MRDALDLNTVRVYAAVVDEQSFAGASRLLAMPSSNVSRHVAALESKLGTRLLERSTRHLRMTEAGRLLYERAKPVDFHAELTRHFHLKLTHLLA